MMIIKMFNCRIKFFKGNASCPTCHQDIKFDLRDTMVSTDEDKVSKLNEALDKIAKESLCKIPEMVPDEEKCKKTISEILKDPREDKKILNEVSKNVLIK